MSGDPEQDYFADGVVEDIITALSRFKSLFVIARNSSFTYKGKAVDIKQVGPSGSASAARRGGERTEGIHDVLIPPGGDIQRRQHSLSSKLSRARFRKLRSPIPVVDQSASHADARLAS